MLLLTLGACSSDSDKTGSSLMTREDSVMVFVDTLPLHTELLECSSVISNPDSFLLGEMETSYGTLQARLLTQLACPVGFRYPENAELDSVCVFLTYSSYYGDGASPLQIDVRQMDKNTLEYALSYNTGIDVDAYCSMSEATRVLKHKSIELAAMLDTTIANNSNASYRQVWMRCNDAFATDFFLNKRDFSSQESFNQQFKGLYLSTNFGGSTVLNVMGVALAVYYHFEYERAGETIRETDMKAFYSNSEVRQVNSIRYLDNDNTGQQEDLVHMLQNDDSCFVISPAGVYTALDIPIRDLTDQIAHNIGDKRVYVNMARMIVYVKNSFHGKQEDFNRDYWSTPANNILLLKKEARNTFFEKKMLPTDTLAILGSLMNTTDSLDRVRYYYSFDISTLLTLQIRDSIHLPDTMHMVFVPVSVERATSNNNGSSTTIGVKQSQELSTTIFPSGKASVDPVRLEVVYSGF